MGDEEEPMHSLTLRWIAVALALLLAAFALSYIASSAAPTVTSAHAASKGDPKDCVDFKSQKRAQKWFKKHNPSQDPAGLDADNDGIACEDNPCPCSYKGAGRPGARVLARL
jgi:hypothetical protein